MFLGHSSLIKEAKHLSWTNDKTLFGLVVLDEMIGKSAEQLSKALYRLTIRLEQWLPNFLERGGFRNRRFLSNG
jgi:hypothetical protein